MNVITDAELARFRWLIEHETGIRITEAKRPMLVARLSRHLRRLSLSNYGQYLAVIKRDNGEKQRCIDAICTNETRFFREPRQFDFLRTVCIPAWKEEAAKRVRGTSLRIWSCGCSTGEEPYSIAMVMSDLLPRAEGWDVQIIATDLSTKGLDAAREGTWPISRARDIPPDYLRRFMLQGVRNQNGTMKAGAEIRSLITFGSVNLNDETYPFDTPFDAIFCRNVLIYFDASLCRKVIPRLFRHLLPRGYFFAGHAETLNGIYRATRASIPNVYIH